MTDAVAATVLTTPESLSELFRRDPAEITDEEFLKIISYFRGQRGKFAQAEEAGQRAPARKKIAPKITSLGDLGL